ncbi:MAG: methyltransferase domain-containing protein [Nitrospira sp.]|nr:methyltransferase domain-containing protein [Nitrospira sp.]
MSIKKSIRSKKGISLKVQRGNSHILHPYRADNDEPESLFERFPWLYAFCREYLFHDHTGEIERSLWPDDGPAAGSRVIELGCGPGFYACRLAEHFHQLHVIGIDRSELLLTRARLRAQARRLTNCRFEKDDVLTLSRCTSTVDAMIASRLFTILAEREQALAEIYRVLRPGGRCFIAEPRSSLRAAAPLSLMWLCARLLALCGDRARVYREPSRVAVMTECEFDRLIDSQPWKRVWHRQDAWYRYAVCEKGQTALGELSVGGASLQ